MTNPPALAARLVALAAIPATLALTAAVAQAAAPAPTEPPVSVTDASTQLIQLPDDAQYYTTIGSFSGRRPVLGADGALTWFYSRQRAVDDGRALGTISIAPSVVGGAGSIQPLLGSVAGTTALRGGNNWDDSSWRDITTLATDAVAWRGSTWILDRRETPRPARVTLVAIRDGEGGRIVARYPKGFTPSNLVITDRGLRAYGGMKVRRSGGRTSTEPAITAPGSTKPIQLKVAGGISSVSALPGGAVLVAGGSTRSSLPDPVLIVDRRGRAKRIADRRSPSAAFRAGTAGMVPVSRGVLMNEESQSDYYATSPIDKTSLVIRSRTGKVVLRRPVAELDYPGAAPCKVAGVVFSVVRLAAGPDGAPVATIACGVSSPNAYGGRDFRWTQATMVGLNPDLTVRWWRPAPEVNISYYSPQVCGSQQTDAYGRLAIVRCIDAGYAAGSTMTTAVAPGTGAPQLGKLGTTKSVGKQAVRARITCRGPVGTGCSGRALITANGQPLGSAEYALPARPGALQGELDRQIQATAPLPARYSVTLLPRS